MTLADGFGVCRPRRKGHTTLETGFLRRQRGLKADGRLSQGQHMILSGGQRALPGGQMALPGRRAALQGQYKATLERKRTLSDERDLSDQHRAHSGKRRVLSDQME